MIYTTITIPNYKVSALTQQQKTFLINVGFVIFGATYIKSVKSNELHIIIQQLVKNTIPFSTKTSPAVYPQGNCTTCKK